MSIRILILLLPYILRFIERLDVETQDLLYKGLSAANEGHDFELNELVDDVRTQWAQLRD